MINVSSCSYLSPAPNKDVPGNTRTRLPAVTLKIQGLMHFLLTSAVKVTTACNENKKSCEALLKKQLNCVLFWIGSGFSDA